MLTRQRAQGLPRSDLEQNSAGRLEQRPYAFSETHRVAKMLDPIARVLRLFVGDPGAGAIRHEGNLRWSELDALEVGAELAQDGLEHARMRSHRHRHTARLHVALREPRL